jgi:hypothetical protein
VADVQVELEASRQQQIPLPMHTVSIQTCFWCQWQSQGRMLNSLPHQFMTMLHAISMLHATNTQTPTCLMHQSCLMHQTVFTPIRFTPPSTPAPTCTLHATSTLHAPNKDMHHEASMLGALSVHHAINIMYQAHASHQLTSIHLGALDQLTSTHSPCIMHLRHKRHAVCLDMHHAPMMVLL